MHVDPNVKPVAQPYSLQKKVDDKIKQLEAEDIIEKVNGSTPWVSPIHVVPKGENDITPVVDMRGANKVIIIERHPIHTVEEVLQELHGNAYFSELDFRSWYHQIVLEENSRDRTFATPQRLL